MTNANDTSSDRGQESDASHDDQLQPDRTVREPTDNHLTAEWVIEPADVSVVIDTDHVRGEVTEADDTTVRVRGDPGDDRVEIRVAATADPASATGEVQLTEPQALEIARRLRDAAGDDGRLARSPHDHLPVDAAVPTVRHAGELTLPLDEPRVEVYREHNADVTLNTHGDAGSVTSYWERDTAMELGDALEDAADWATGRHP